MKNTIGGQMVGQHEQDLINKLKPLLEDSGFANAFRFLVEQKKSELFEEELFEQLFPSYYDLLQEYRHQEAYEEELNERD